MAIAFIPSGAPLPFNAFIPPSTSVIDSDHAFSLLRLYPDRVTLGTIARILEVRASASVLWDVVLSPSLSRSDAVCVLSALSRGRHLPDVVDSLLRRYPGATRDLLATEVMES